MIEREREQWTNDYYLTYMILAARRPAPNGTDKTCPRHFDPPQPYRRAVQGSAPRAGDPNGDLETGKIQKFLFDSER